MPTISMLMTLISTSLLALCCLPLAAEDNPLLTPPGTPLQTPPFDRIGLDHYLPAVEEGIRRQQAEIDAITDNPAAATFDNTVAALDGSGRLLTDVTAVFFALLGTVNSPQMQETVSRISPLLSAHNDNIVLNAKLFARLKTVYDGRAASNLTPDQLFLLENIYRRFLRSGAMLNDEQKSRLRDINREHALLVLKFEDNVLAETNDSYIVIDDTADLAGLPDGVVATARETARQMGRPDAWVFTTQRPSFTPFMQYAASRPLRQTLYTAYVMRGDRNNDHDNKALLQKIFTLREERARILGYPNPAAFYEEERMAKVPDTVEAFLHRAWTPALARARAEAAEMQAIIDGEQGGFALAPWDWWYYAEKLRRAKYDLDNAALRPYFTLQNARQGVFTLAEKLYGLRLIQRQDIPVYHPDVQVYEVREHDDRLLGVLYMDFYCRDSKQGGAWSGAFREAFRQDDERVIPFSTLVCNFPRPTADGPSFLSIDEVETLFHEFGHSLNTLLADNRYRTTFTPQDAVELPSQIMENWVLEPEMLRLYARHYRTGEVIPAELIAKLGNGRLFNQGFKTVEYIAASFLDMAWHTLDTARNVNVDDFENKAMADIGLMPEILPRYRSTYFTHIHGGYEAGYYSYLWAEVLDADAFQAFKETSLFDKKTAASFRTNVLEKLGTEEAMGLYARFRGREPEVEPFLKRRGLL